MTRCPVRLINDSIQVGMLGELDAMLGASSDRKFKAVAVVRMGTCGFNDFDHVPDIAQLSADLQDAATERFCAIWASRSIGYLNPSSSLWSCRIVA